MDNRGLEMWKWKFKSSCQSAMVLCDYTLEKCNLNDFFKKTENGPFKTTEKQSERSIYWQPKLFDSSLLPQESWVRTVKLTDIMICKGIRRRVSNLSIDYQNTLRSRIE